MSLDMATSNVKGTDRHCFQSGDTDASPFKRFFWVGFLSVLGAITSTNKALSLLKQSCDQNRNNLQPIFLDTG